MERTSWIMAIVLVVGGAALAAFGIQNSSEVVALSWNLGPVGAWRLADPVPAPALMLICFSGGFFPTLLWALWRSASLRSEIERLRREAASGARRSNWDG